MSNKTAKELIDSILTKVNMTNTITDSPFDSTDTGIIEVVELLNSKLSELSTEFQFQQIKKTASFNVYSEWEADTDYSEDDIIQNSNSRYICTTAGTSGSTDPTFSTSTTTEDNEVIWEYVGSAYEYPLEDIASDIDTIIDQTFFDMTNQHYLIRLSDEEWQRKTAFSVSEDSRYYKVQGNSIWLFPEFSSESELSFQYYSFNVVNSTDDDDEDITTTEFSKNEDTTPIDDDILIWGTAYDFYMLKGIQSSAQWAYNRYIQQLERRKSSSQPLEKITLGQPTFIASNVKDGSWD